MEKLYFAYGSNMSQARLEQRVGKVTRVYATRLPFFKLAFDTGHSSAFANMVMTGNRRNFVEGVIYSLTNRQLQQLDGYEGHPYFYTRVNIPFTIQSADGLLNVDVSTYISINPMYKCIHPSTHEYMSYVKQGCKENNFRTTLAFLETLPIQEPFSEIKKVAKKKLSKKKSTNNI